MASYRASGKHSEINWCGIAVGLAAIVGFTGGCSHEDDSTATQATGDKPGVKAATTAPAAVNNTKLPTDAEIVADEESRSKPKGPKPTFLRLRDITVQWDAPDGEAKTPRMRRRLKVFSDGSEVPDGKYEEWYRNGQQLQVGEYVDGVRQGPFKLWHENGQVRKVENYLNGKLEGTWKVYRDDGTLESQVSYKDNVRDGRWIDYSADGKTPVKQEEYKAGKLGGTRILYFANGKPEIEEHYKNGVPDGKRTIWNENGKLRREEEYADGQLTGTQKIYNADGSLNKQVELKNGQPVGNSDAAVAGGK